MAGAQPVTFSVDAQAPMVEPELTEVGELHSLTDWQVSEASEEAELDEFCRREGPRASKSNRKSKRGDGAGKRTHRERDRHVHRRGKEERSRGLGLFSPLCQSCTHTEAFKPSNSSVRRGEVQACQTASPPDPDVCVSSVCLAPARRRDSPCPFGHVFSCRKPRPQGRPASAISQARGPPSWGVCSNLSGP